MLTEAQLDRICARRHLSRADLLAIVLFLHAHPQVSVVRAIFEFVRGRGPAAIARGRCPRDKGAAAFV